MTRAQGAAIKTYVTGHESGAKQEQVILDLHGPRAEDGLELAALESFIDHLRRALRDFDRDRRGKMVKRGGHPDTGDTAATALRVVHFRIGSGILTLEPAVTDDAGALEVDAEHRATATLSALVDAVEQGGKLSPAVLDALAGAVRSLGQDASFGVYLPTRRPRTVIDERRVEQLRPRDESEPAHLSITGRMHMLELAEPAQKVGVRATDGVEWLCAYEPDLKPVVMAAIDKVVRVEGIGRKVTPLSGRMNLEGIDVFPEFAQDELFTTEALPLEELQQRQGVGPPQGLDALTDHDWEDDEAGKRFLEAMLGDTS